MLAVVLRIAKYKLIRRNKNKYSFLSNIIMFRIVYCLYFTRKTHYIF